MPAMTHRPDLTHGTVRVCGSALMASVVLAGLSGVAMAAESPAILTTAGSNAVPACATPQKLMALLKSRNPRLEPRFEGVATAYAKVGKELGVRYDYAFFQMMAETGSLSFKGGRARLVKAEQNNFAGLGAIGNAEPGESFADLETGVRAHLQHVLLYAGQKIATPVAERTRKVQEWGVLSAWQAELGGAVSFAEMAKKWSSATSVYPSLIEGHAETFRSQFCGGAAPAEDVPLAASPPRPRGQDLARMARETAKAEGQDKRASLGAGAVATVPPQINILNREPPQAIEPAPSQRIAAVAIPKAPTARPAPDPVQPAAAPGTAVTAMPRTAIQPDGPVAGGNCRVWTASYGGTRGVIVRWLKDGIVNFTVIDVNQGQEQKEAQAFIGGYTKNGVLAGSYATQAQALEKAFEYCPEG